MSQRINTQLTNKIFGKQKGMTFIEVLIALVIIVAGILGAVAMQATAKKGSFDAMQRSLASALAQDMLERMRSNDPRPINGILNTYVGTYGAADPGVVAPAPTCSTQGTLCNSAQMVTTDLYQWTQLLRGANVTSGGQNAGGLTNAIGCITENNNAVTVTVSWQGRTSTQDGAAAAAFATNVGCGTANDKRRQVHIQAFIF